MAIIRFPEDFKWGVATAAYQIEGAAHEGGRGKSIWDTFSYTPGKVLNGDNGDVACDSYHRYPEDVQLMKELGVDIYRFSVSWPRIFPNGVGEVNQEGLDYYHRLVDELLAAGIEPMCTLYHWDLPQALQDKGGWENRETVDAFVNYAETMFQSFEGKIKSWLTINEPWCVSFLSNYLGLHAPGKKDLSAAVTISHHLLLAHGKASLRFKELDVEGQIGFAPNFTWLDPYSNRQEDIDACQRGIGWMADWFLDPIFKGTYPDYLVKLYEENNATLPIEPGDMNFIKDSVDYIGINYYESNVGRFNEDAGILQVENVDMGYKRTDIGWYIEPAGFYNILTYLTDRYGKIPMYITENGICINDGVENGEVNDSRRIDYLQAHITAVHRSLQSGVNLKGYITWSLLDNFEWAEGYSKRFGLVHVNYRTLERTKKDSYYWYQKIINNGWFTV
ncbi:GH1 family beta-glucosidase [Aquibacillus koreensis]|uniref:Beta-glucosidase n=1 Tax=Aquibacillus koreensis TaxID=279446 RepID=A0A9X3WQG9_9BACI|nr:GH1 family beta-glucosidase [Aquibacillus koreensis]MCT2537211.1 GH1 family beta-glucosidase [Aquibacillus koreensis]MDC3421559.1 GH1 family beta-glucosidase [Aquibacillus koreensis]